MRIGFVVEGESEYRSLPSLLGQLKDATGNTFLSPRLARFDPLAEVGVITRRCLPRMRELQERRADRLLVLTDRETRPPCAPAFAYQLEPALRRAAGSQDVWVVVKEPLFESWLIADLEALRAHPRRFSVSDAVVSRIEPNKADRASAAETLRRCVPGKPGYRKVEDSKLIMREADVGRMASHSRSFRRLLRLCGHPVYATQSKTPA